MCEEQETIHRCWKGKSNAVIQRIPPGGEDCWAALWDFRSSHGAMGAVLSSRCSPPHFHTLGSVGPSPSPPDVDKLTEQQDREN